MWEQRCKAWGTCAVRKGMFSLGEGARNLEDVASEEDETVREPLVLANGRGASGGGNA